MRKTLLTFLALCISALTFAQTTFAAIQNIDPDTGEEPYEITSGDLDDDGFMDIVMATYRYNGGTPIQDYIKWYKNDGSGNFTLQTTVSSTIRWVDGLIITDIDGQNGLDIVATSASQNKLVCFLSDGLGGFGSEVAVSGTISGPGEVAAADINDDGNMDLATVAFTTNKSVWFLGNGDGTFGTEQIIESGTTAQPFTIDLGDFDGDTDIDALIGYYNSANGYIEIFYNQYIESGTMTVGWIKDLVTVDTGISYLSSADFADVNNDGVMDVVKLDNVSGKVEWFSKIKDDTSTPNTINPWIPSKGTSGEYEIVRPGAVMVADLDNDTFNDVILTNSNPASANTDESVIWYKGANNTSPSSISSLVGDYSNNRIFDITTSDFDADGDVDITIVDNFLDTVEWFENEWDLLGIEDNFLNKIRIYPNPTAEKLYIKSTISDNFKVSVFDLLGKKVMDGSLNLNSPLDVSQLNNGIYIVRFDDYNSTYKFVKE